MSLKIVIIGGVAAGASAATKARRVNESAEITLIEKGPYVSFANCGLPYYIGEQIQERQALLMQTPESLMKRFQIRALVRHEAISIDRAAKTVLVQNLESGVTFLAPYDKLILAPGAGAIVPPLPGIRNGNIFTIKTVPDSDAVKRFMAEHHPQRAVVIGAGFIGLEAAEAFKLKGLEVTVVEMLPQVLPPLDADMARFVSEHLESEGVRLILADGLKAFHHEGGASEVELQSGRRIPMDLAVLSIGVRPELKLARDAGLTIGSSGGISVDEHQRTSDPDVYAAGDAAEVTHLVTGKKTRIPLAGPASKQGRVAGAHAAGEDLSFPGALGTAIVETMGITAAKTGLSEKEALTAGIGAYAVFTHSLDHAGYYPGASLMHVKLIAERESGRLLGAQIVGERGVDKRIDVLATALSAGMKVTDLEAMDLAYAPQFSSARDPIVMAGFVASNVLRHDMPSLTCGELDARIKAGQALQIVDVRERAEYKSGHLPQAVLIPLDELRERAGELDPSKETVVYCRVGLRGYLASRILQQRGFRQVLNLTGGILSCPPALGTESNGSGIKRDGSEASVQELKSAVEGGSALALDLREPDEYRYQRIAGTQNVPLSALDREMGRLPKDRKLLIFCQTGTRTAEAFHTLRSHGFVKVRGVRGGVQAWAAAGYPLERTGPLPIMRQVQIIAGSVALAGGLIPSGQWIAAVVGAGLLYAGLSGNCGMAIVLGKMPWNKRASGKSGAAACGSAPCGS